MTESNAVRRWKKIALVALAALAVTIAGWAMNAAVQWRQLEAALEQAEKAKQEADRARQEERQARDRAERALYASQIQLAQKAFEDGLPKTDKP
jgi:hypothetical protein